jgi:succinate dehydrogenase / fumarate reductase, cytochrome b subunit
MSVATVPSTTSLGKQAKHPLSAFFTSSVGRKWVVALSGLALLGFVIGHLLGNLQFFLPNQTQINLYAVKLHELGPLLWIIRLGLLAVFVIHIVTTISLVLENKKARPQKYAVLTPQRSSRASRTMALSGLTVLSFVIYHLLHFTIIAFNPEYKTLVDPAGHQDVYSRMVLGFSNPLIAGFYILSVSLLAFHLKHGISSTVQTLGIKSTRIAGLVDNGGKFLAVAIGLGFISLPLSVLLHLRNLPTWYPLH